MKKILIVAAVLVGCFVIALSLILLPTLLGLSANGNEGPRSLGSWLAYSDTGIPGVMVDLATNEIRVFVPPPGSGTSKVISAKGHWRLRSFYCDSDLDAPSEVLVATELKNEDIEFNAKYFLPGAPEKVTCVLYSRQSFVDFPYPVQAPGKSVPYPPPKGMIRPGMLKCDLEVIAWNADKIEGFSVAGPGGSPPPLSDGTINRNFFAAGATPSDDTTDIYTYHSDRSNVPALHVTVYRGRVTKVEGGAEDTSDAPFQFPPRKDPDTSPDQEQNEGWAGRLFDFVFGK